MPYSGTLLLDLLTLTECVWLQGNLQKQILYYAFTAEYYIINKLSCMPEHMSSNIVDLITHIALFAKGY